MRYIDLSPEQQTHLTLLYKTSQDHRERQRAQALLLSSRHYSIEELATLFELDRDTISRWMDRWEQLPTASRPPTCRTSTGRGAPARCRPTKKKRDRVG